MKNWYRKPIVKIIAVLIALIVPAAAALSFVMLAGFSGTLMPGDMFRKAGETYEESESFESMMNSATTETLEQISRKNRLEVDGNLDRTRLVDIIEYYETREISGENINGLAYTVGELAEWGADYLQGNTEYEEGNIVVCQKPDGTYYYYFMSEFKSLLADGKLQLDLNDEDKEQFLSELEDGYYISGYGSGSPIIRDEDGTILYTDCWTFDEVIKEVFAPDGAESILDVVNQTPALNGKLSKVYEYLRYALYDLGVEVNWYEQISDTWTEGNTNFTYLFVNEETKQVYTNNSALQDYDAVKTNLEALKNNENSKYVIVKPKLKDFESNMDVTAGDWKNLAEAYDSFLGDHYIVAAAVDTSYPIQDAFYTSSQNYNKYAPFLRSAGAVLILSLILFIIVLIWLTIAAGRRTTDDELHLNGFDRWKTEISAAVIIGLWVAVTFILSESWSGFGYTTTYYGAETIYEAEHVNLYYTFSITPTDICVVVIYMLITAALFLTGYLSLVRRIKGKTLWKNSILKILLSGGKKVLLFIAEAWRKRRITFRIVAAFLGFILLHWITMLSYGYRVFVIITLLAEAAAAYYLIRNAMAADQIKQGVREISSGNVDYQIPLQGMRGSELETAEMVNDIGNGLQKAVEESMKSERLKTDLITNVSHDIKTPLTSIINYVDLLKRENFEDPKIQGYLEVLETKSQRLKTLTEDVVEASKVSSGNINLEYMDVNLVEMLNQTIGEFSEKMEAKQLQVVATFPETAAVIHVDGRRMWRVLENIFNNAAKYAMPGTRVYADLKIEGKEVLFSLKNISEQPLNINADELTERFIRGDVSRSTEGSGLGLSIAKSLTEMQGGKFQLYLDGDLFKVNIEFPKAG